MKTKVWIGILTALLLVCGILSILIMGMNQNALQAEVWSEGELKYTLLLSVNRTVTVESSRGSNVVTVKDGAVAVTQADCPDHYCMDRGFCTGGTQIVCLPNRLVIKFLGGQTVDGVTG